MIVSEIKLYELLKAKLGEKEAEAFVEILEKKVDHKFDEAKQTLATKEDLANTKVDLIKWMVALLLGLFIALVGAMAAIIKLMIN
jgi:hypothetical protein